VNDVAAFMVDPQVAASGAVVPMEDPEAGRCAFSKPVRFPDTPTSFRRLPPRLAQHTEEVLCETGFGPDEIEALRAINAIF
jgi:crotonobetainyl-CoA:carnitine CoA-transferase CaiB-like acyl-CoA transferase